MDRETHTTMSALDQGEALLSDLRPRSLKAYIGQDKITKPLSIFIQAAKRRSAPLDHTLLYGPPGLGKTTLSRIIAYEMGVECHQTSGPVIEKAGDLAAMLTHVQPFDVLFIDEIHRLSPGVEEMLYSAMEENKLDIMLGEGPAARSVKIDIAPFTLIAATTRAGMLTSPLRDRFGIIFRLQYYDLNAMQAIIQNAAEHMSLPILDSALHLIATCSRGTPRIANRLLRRIRDCLEMSHLESVTDDVVVTAMALLDIDMTGLEWIDRRYLQIIFEDFDHGPVGLQTLSAALSEDKDTILDVIEPYLLQNQYIMRSPRGRMLTDKGVAYILSTHKKGKDDA
jgi:holliday junction DNA helicase RuvB